MSAVCGKHHSELPFSPPLQSSPCLKCKIISGEYYSAMFGALPSIKYLSHIYHISSISTVFLCPCVSMMFSRGICVITSRYGNNYNVGSVYSHGQSLVFYTWQPQPGWIWRSFQEVTTTGICHHSCNCYLVILSLCSILLPLTQSFHQILKCTIEPTVLYQMQ